MNLKRLSVAHPAWVLDGRYEIHIDSLHHLRIVDRQTMIKGLKYDWSGKDKPKEILVPQEHVYFDGDGLSSREYGLHNVEQPIHGTNSK